MKRSLRYLRIAFAASCLIACVLLIVLWVRSYWRWDVVNNENGPVIVSGAGQLLLNEEFNVGRADPVPDDWFRGEVYFAGHHFKAWSFPAGALTPLGFGVALPFWAGFVVAISLTAAPWIRLRSRFSLRTLLISTTLVAVVLGLVVYASRG